MVLLRRDRLPDRSNYFDECQYDIYLVMGNVGDSDGGTDYDVGATPEQVARWRAARDQWLSAQEEMRGLFNQAEDIHQAALEESAKQHREEWERARREEEADARREAELDEQFGPREWYVLDRLNRARFQSTTKFPARVIRRIIHHESCGAVKKFREYPDWGRFLYEVRRIRPPDIEKALREPVPDNAAGTETCKRCARHLPTLQQGETPESSLTA